MNRESSKAGSLSKRRCFVISPIGVEGSEQRQHADDIYDFIIKPAMDDCGVMAVRSDQIAHPGRITDQMFRSLFQADFCIAVVTFDNPNVFYELAIAHAASKPVIMLNKKGHALPFDIKDLRCLEYEYLPRPLAKGEYAKQVAERIRSLEATGWQAPDFVGAYGSPMGERLSGVTMLLAKSREYETFGGWERSLEQVRTVFDIAGFSLSQWRNVRGFSEKLSKLCGEGCRVRILLLDPGHPVLQHSINRSIPEIIPARVLSEMTAMVTYFQEIVAATPNVEFRLLRKGVTSIEITLTDEEALLQPYLYSEGENDVPLFGCRRGSRLYQVASQEFNALWEANAP